MLLRTYRIHYGLVILIMMLALPVQEVFSVDKPLPKDGLNHKTEARFYAKDTKTGTKGEYLGYATLDNGKLNVKVTDKRLEKLVKSKIVTRGGTVKEETMPNGRKVMVGGILTYEPGTKEHLDAVINSLPSLGYLGEKSTASMK